MAARGGIARGQEAAARVSTVLEDSPYPPKEAVEKLDREFIADNLSPGGSADLLSLCWMLHFLKEEPI